LIMSRMSKWVGAATLRRFSSDGSCRPTADALQRQERIERAATQGNSTSGGLAGQ
jgi:hypothetical protein